MTNDGFHTYTYDAEGNILSVNGGSVAKYTYDAINQRVRVDTGSTSREFVFNINGQRASTWDGNTGAVIRGNNYWGAQPLSFYAANTTHFQHQDWLGTERARTDVGTGAIIYATGADLLMHAGCANSALNATGQAKVPMAPTVF